MSDEHSPPRSTRGRRSAHEGGRRQARKGDLNEAAILATAAGLLASKPASQIKVEELATGAGISRSTFYFYFDSVDAVIRALVGPTVSALVPLANDLFPVSGDRRRTISTTITSFLQLWQFTGGAIRAAGTASDSDPTMRAMWLEARTELYGKAATRITAERRAGNIAPGPPPKILAQTLVGMLYRAGYELSLDEATPRDYVRHGEALTEIWLQILYGDEGPPDPT